MWTHLTFLYGNDRGSFTMEIGHSLGCERGSSAPIQGSFLLCPQTTVNLLSLQPCRLTTSAHLHFCILTFTIVSGSVVPRPETQDSVSSGTPSSSAILFFQGRNLLDLQVPEACLFIHQKYTGIFLPVFGQALWIKNE